MPRGDKPHRHFAVEQLAADMSSCVIAGLRLWVTKRRNHRRAQIEVRNQLCARAFPDLHCITNVIGMPVRKQNKIGMVKRG